MNEINPSKYIDKINKKNDSNNRIKKYINGLFVRLFFVTVILLSLAIIYKKESNLSDQISNYFFEENISFTKIKKMYDKYLGGLVPIIKDDKSVTQVFNEKLNYSNTSIYYDGVKLSVADSYLVPALSEGMVVFVGEKENYGKTVIIENLDGVDYWYSNITNTSLKLYDYIEKGSLIGEVKKELYMVFSRNGKFLNYEEYIS